MGDLNVAPEDRDSYDPVGLKDTIHHTVEERQHFRQLELGLTDAFRMFSSLRRAIRGGTGNWLKEPVACA